MTQTVTKGLRKIQISTESIVLKHLKDILKLKLSDATDEFEAELLSDILNEINTANKEQIPIAFGGLVFHISTDSADMIRIILADTRDLKPCLDALRIRLDKEFTNK